MIKVCKGCQNGFEDCSRTHNRQYCDDCRRKARLETYCKANAKYRQSPKSKIAQSRGQIKFYQLLKNKIVKAEYMVEYWKRPEVKIAKIKYDTKFNQSIKGKVCSARQRSKRRARSTNSELYVARVLQLHRDKESCAICDKSYERTHQVDHIIALCNGGSDDWSNLQPICVKCHRIKTGQDIGLWHKNKNNINNLKQIQI